MREVITQTYFIALPILLGYMVWLLQEQKKKQTRYVKERDERIAGACDFHTVPVEFVEDMELAFIDALLQVIIHVAALNLRRHHPQGWRATDGGGGRQCPSAGLRGQGDSTH